MTFPRLVVLGIMAGAFALRVWALPHTPPGLWYDEAYNALDALWMTDTGHYQVFFVGNNGREPMWHYLLLLSTSLLGNTTFAVRWVGAVVGTLTIPVVYCFAGPLLAPFAANRHHRRWLAAAACAWVAVSWWHLHLSRAGFRPVLLSPLLMLALYFFMRGVAGSQGGRVAGSQSSRVARSQGNRTAAWPFATFGDFQSKGIRDFVWAGLFLGLTQYTYLPARLAPLIFIALLLLWATVAFLPKKIHHSPFTIHHSPLIFSWSGFLITALVAALVFLPLGLFFLNNPASFSSRTGDVLVAPQTFSELVSHVGRAVSLFLGAGHDLHRHHLPGRAMLGWLEIPFFWLGLISLLRPSALRRAETHLILIGFGVMWLPALLADPPVHALRPVGLMPFYYLVVTIGLYHAANFTSYVLRPTSYAAYAIPTIFVLTLTVTALINTTDYFQRWANHPETYKEYNGPLVDLTRHVIDLTKAHDVIIPLHVYAHPTTRYLLHDQFPEQTSQPPPLVSRPIEMLLVPDNFQLLYVGNIPASPALVRLTRNEAGQGAAYVSRPPRSDEQQLLNDTLVKLTPQPFKDGFNQTIAQFVPISNLPSPISNLFDSTPLRTIGLTWADEVQLLGYDVTPPVIQPGETLTLNLYWHSLINQTFDRKLFIQLINASGEPLNQWEVDAFREDMYRWRPDGILPSQHILPLGSDIPAGTYLIRLGFFDRESGQRLPIRMGESANERIGETSPLDQVQLGLFYVSPDGTNPHQPQTKLSATFADHIQLTGVSIPDIHHSPFTIHHSQLPITFHWQARHPTAIPYTVFLQLLDDQGQVISGWDSQPFNGLYPTTLWSPGELISDTFVLPLPAEGLPPGNYRLISGFYDVTTGQRLLLDDGTDFVELVTFSVKPN
ncbi:MAG: hypothetical protein R3264_10635 [Anaerolineae bacterium]|nr:hypothetical protein [Anaerolineae bacterium]